jgi:hypothetical protein
MAQGRRDQVSRRTPRVSAHRMDCRIRAGRHRTALMPSPWARSRSSVSSEAVREHASAHNADPRRAQGLYQLTKTIVKEQRPARAA